MTHALLLRPGDLDRHGHAGRYEACKGETDTDTFSGCQLSIIHHCGKQSETGEAAEVVVPVLELAEDGVCRCGEEYADESKLRGADGDGGNMHE